MPRSSRRVVITGSGPLTAFGLGVAPLWEALEAGRTGIAPIETMDASGFPCTAWAAVPASAFDVRQVVPKSYRKATKVMARDIELAVGAAHSAVTAAGLVTKGTAEGTPPTIAPHRVGCHIGAGLIPADAAELAAALHTSRDAEGNFDIGEWGRAGMQNLTPLWLLKYLPNMLACHVTIIHDCQGPSNTITCAEPSGALSIGESMRVIGRGDADACLSGGAESKLNTMGMLRQHFAGRLAAVPPGTSAADAASRVRPFAPDACGTILGEAGAILVLEAMESAAARGARPTVELAGFGASQCACVDTVGVDLSASGPDIAAAIDAALADAGVAASEVDAVVPLGMGHAATDRAEAAALREAFGDRLASIPLVTLTPTLGACGAGASALAVIVGAECISRQMLPARLSTARSGELGLDADACPARGADLRTVLTLSTGLGGQNAAVVLRRTS